MKKQYSNLSIELTKQISKEDKKNNGIYFTPLDIIEKAISELLKLKLDIKTILEPSCGSCEFIDYIDNNFANAHITGIEYNNEIYNKIKNLTLKNNHLRLLHEDYLNYDTDLNTNYDLIIGNPPYYVITNNKSNVYKEFYEGRANIFILFIVHSIKRLNKNGVLLFILPKNFMNCLYYNKLRHHIYRNYTIVAIIDCSDCNYIETDQETIIFIIKKKDSNNNENGNYAIINGNYIIFNTNENIIKLKALYNCASSLNSLNFEVKVGTIVWNQHKAILTDDNTKTRLIYSSDIKDEHLINNEYKNKEKKNYIEKEGLDDLLLVVNRGYGKGEYKFNYCLIDIREKYLIENHLICIKYKSIIAKEELLKLYEKIIISFTNEKTKEFIKIYFGNNAINTTELQYLLPIY